MASSGNHHIFNLVLVCLLVITPHVSYAITCGQVFSYLSPCVNYVRFGGVLPSACCGGVKGLNSAAKTTPDRQQTCVCLKNLLTSIPGIKPGLAAGIPGKCGVSVGYPISLSVDCTKVH